MKHLFIVLVLSTFIASCTENTPKVLLFMREGSADLEYMLNKEVGVMKDVLERSGYRVVIATVDGSSFAAGSFKVQTDLRVADVDVNEYAGIIIPCMAAGTNRDTMVSSETVTVARKAISAGKPVAAQTGAVLVLGEAGLLKEKKYASMREIVNVEEGIHSGTGVVRDGLIITSAICPYMARESNIGDGTEELALTLVEAMKGGE